MHSQMKDKVNSMKHPSRKKQELLMLLKKNGSLTFEEIMSHFTISEPALRKHIHQLERENLIEKKSHKQKIGRPFYTYHLTKQAHQLFPNQNEQLPLQLLQDLEDLYGKSAVKKLLNQRMKREKNIYESNCDSDNLEEKLEEVVRIQNENGYMAELYKHENGVMELINYHCPIYNLAHSYGQVCANEKSMYEQLFPDFSIKIHSNIVAGDHACKWIFAPKEDGS